MTTSTWTSPNFFSVVFALTVLALPTSAFAAVHVTEVMYDAPGSDQGHEWIEVSNDNSGAVDITGWRFAQGGTNHMLSAVEGTTSLAAGQVAIISNNPQTFLTDYPSYTGTLFKSSFSLSNTGETIALKDKSLKTVDSVSYSSTEGASGDGNSLHLSGSSFVPGAPNPGSLAATVAIVPPAKVVVQKTAAKATKKKATTKASSSSYSYSTNTTKGADQAATPLVAFPTIPQLPAVSSLWLYGIGLAALLIVGAGAAFYAKPVPSFSIETSTEKQEFELE